MPGHPFRRADDKQYRRPRKGMFLLPSLFTSLSIAAGYYALSQTLQGSISEPWHFDNAARAVGIAIVLDGFDGRIARMTNTSSDFGRELDSLADVITFGVAPALLAMRWGLHDLPPLWDPALRLHITQLGAVATFLFLIAGAARLARFNIQKDPQPSNPGRPGRKYFVGMPIPAGAGVIAAVVHFTGGTPIAVWWLSILWMIFVVAAGFLMVSTWRFYSFKDIDFRGQHPFRSFILIAGIGYAIFMFSQWTLFLLALGYMLSGVILRLMYALHRPSTPPPPITEAQVS